MSEPQALYLSDLYLGINTNITENPAEYTLIILIPELFDALAQGMNSLSFRECPLQPGDILSISDEHGTRSITRVIISTVKYLEYTHVYFDRLNPNRIIEADDWDRIEMCLRYVAGHAPEDSDEWHAATDWVGVVDSADID